MLEAMIISALLFVGGLVVRVRILRYCYNRQIMKDRKAHHKSMIAMEEAMKKAMKICVHERYRWAFQPTGRLSKYNMIIRGSFVAVATAQRSDNGDFPVYEEYLCNQCGKTEWRYSHEYFIGIG